MMSFTCRILKKLVCKLTIRRDRYITIASKNFEATKREKEDIKRQDSANPTSSSSHIEAIRKMTEAKGQERKD